MYSIKPIINHNKRLADDDLPTSMYRMKSINENDKIAAIAVTSPSSDVSATKLSTPSAVTSSTSAAINLALSQQITNLLKRVGAKDMAALELRQDKVLEQLTALKSLLMSTHASLGICAKPAQKPVIIKTEVIGAQSVKEAASKAPKPSNIKQRPINTAHLQDIVINANPENVPYSLVAIKKLWQNRLNISIRVCTHSSIVVLPAAALAFNEALQRLATDVDEISSLPKLNVVLIWKNVPQLEMVSSASNFFAIVGEVNILRYLNRIGPNEHSYDMVSLAESIEIDATLDLCTRLLAAGLKERQVVLQELLKRLNGRDYYGGEQVVLSDLAVSSSVKQLPKNLVPAPLSAWLARISPIVGY